MLLRLAISLTLLLGHVATTAAQGKDEWGDALPAGALMRMGTSRFRHAGHIYSMAYSPDGRYLVTGNSRWIDSSVILWDAQTGEEIRSWRGHAHVVRSVAISPDNKRVAVCNGYGKLVLYDVATGKESWQFETENPEQARFSSDGTTLFVADRKIVRRWDLNTGKELDTLRGHSDNAFSIAIAPKGKLIATCSFDGTVRLFDGQEKGAPVHRHTFVALSRYGTRAAFSPDGKRLVCGSFDDTLRLWDTETFREVWRTKTEAVQVSVWAFSPDGKTVASGGQNVIEIRDAANGNVIHTVKFRKQAITHILFSPDGKRIATAGEHAAIQFWDPATGKEIARGEGHQHAVSAGAFSPDGKTLATVSDESFIRLWDLNTGKVRRIGDEKHAIHSIAFTPDGKRLATSATFTWPALWDLSTGHEVERFSSKLDAGFHPGGKVTFAADGKTLASSASDLRIRLWTVTDRKERTCSFRGKMSSLDSLESTPDSMGFVLAPDGKTFATTRLSRGRDALILWDVALDKERIKLADRGQPVAFSPDGRLVAILDEQHVSLVETATGIEVRRMKRNDIRLNSAAFSPDGKTLAMSGTSSAITLWEIATAKERRIYTGHRGSVRFVTFSPDGRQLASGGDDHTALLWDLSGATAKRVLTPKECDTLWTELGGADAEKAYQAIWTLAGSADQAVPFLQGKLKPIAPPDPKRVARLIAELDSDRFAVRQVAMQELEELRELAETALRGIPQGKGTLEYRRRVEELLHRGRTAPPPPEQLRQLRAIEVLEHARTPVARRLLDTIAQGTPEARLTQDAKAAVDRHSQRGVRPLE